MTPERRLVTEEWITAFEQAAQNQEQYMRDHLEEMENNSTRRLLQAQLDAVLSMAEDLRTQLKESEEHQEITLVWAVRICGARGKKEPIAYCTSEHAARKVYEEMIEDAGSIDVSPFYVPNEQWIGLFAQRVEYDTIGRVTEGD